MFKCQGGSFLQSLGQAKIKEIKKLSCIQRTQLQESFLKYYFTANYHGT